MKEFLNCIVDSLNAHYNKGVNEDDLCWFTYNMYIIDSKDVVNTSTIHIELYYKTNKSIEPPVCILQIVHQIFKADLVRFKGDVEEKLKREFMLQIFKMIDER